MVNSNIISLISDLNKAAVQGFDKLVVFHYSGVTDNYKAIFIEFLLKRGYPEKAYIKITISDTKSGHTNQQVFNLTEFFEWAVPTDIENLKKEVLADILQFYPQGLNSFIAAGEFEEFLIPLKNKPNLKIIAKKIAFAKSAVVNWRWQEALVLETASKVFYCVIVNRSLNPNEEDRFKYKAFTKLDKITNFFQFSHLAKELYTQLNISSDKIQS